MTSLSVGDASIAAPQWDTAPSGGNNALRSVRWAPSRPRGTWGTKVAPGASTLAGATWSEELRHGPRLRERTDGPGRWRHLIDGRSEPPIVAGNPQPPSRKRRQKGDGGREMPSSLVADRVPATKKALISRAVSDGETRTRTGDTTIFRESPYNRFADEPAANRTVPNRSATPRSSWFRPLARWFGTSRKARSPKPPSSQVRGRGVRSSWAQDQRLDVLEVQTGPRRLRRGPQAAL